MPLRPRENDRRCWDKICDEFVAAHPELYVQDEQLVVDDEERARLAELEEAYAEAERQWREVMGRYGYRWRVNDSDSAQRTFRTEVGRFSEWLARGYREGEGQDIEFNPVSGQCFRPHWKGDDAE